MFALLQIGHSSQITHRTHLKNIKLLLNPNIKFFKLCYNLSMKTITFKRFGRFGRLGNQLWQLCGIAGAVKQYNEQNNENYEVVMPHWDYKDFFSFPKHWFVDKEIIQKSKSVHEILTDRHDFYLVSKKFLPYVSNNIEQWIQPSDKAKEILKEYVKKYNPKNKTAMHVRRGDYLTFAGGINLLPKTYYEKNWPQSDVLIFSDDIDWCKQNFPKTEIVENTKPWIDLMLMRMCQSHVIANSTFSWWGAYGSKDVTYPSPFFKHTEINIALDSWKPSSWT